ncbi:hypothetical protein THAOC_19362 [Thalassiosira oceanica]|uniref:Ubiquitin-like domain-containing protein n=1 Tax=Thalassiosira oceanica TaxID=159749 RepID=K0S4Y0_THAOC|nr:hypothetical protein THAOC_19362 [Thalassiosira oceanica]|eukprot:EJK60305.1 hypothetical protein THAOC_19362 [Thalassiosira oceanica]
MNVVITPTGKEQSLEDFRKGHDSSDFASFGGEMQIYVKALTGNSIALRCRPEDTIGAVKCMIQDKDKDKGTRTRKEGVPVDDQRLILAGVQLEDSRKLSDFCLEKSCSLFLATIRHSEETMIHPSSGRVDRLSGDVGKEVSDELSDTAAGDKSDAVKPRGGPGKFGQISTEGKRAEKEMMLRHSKEGDSQASRVSRGESDDKSPVGKSKKLPKSPVGKPMKLPTKRKYDDDREDTGRALNQWLAESTRRIRRISASPESLEDVEFPPADGRVKISERARGKHIARIPAYSRGRPTCLPKDEHVRQPESRPAGGPSPGRKPDSPDQGHTTASSALAMSQWLIDSTMEVLASLDDRRTQPGERGWNQWDQLALDLGFGEAELGFARGPARI